MPRWPFLLRLMLTLLVAAGLTLGGFGFGTSPAVAAPMRADCPHHAGMAAETGAEHGKGSHEHGKQTGCQCPLMTCSGWTLGPIAFNPVPFDPTVLPHLFAAAAAFAPHPPGVPLQPPRA